MQSFGDSSNAPVASNDTEDGRTRNRRVELLKQ
jgi:flagellar motor protein MotB